nr:MAG TPA: hypothetical protein [Caudoviricetes sp.]
MRQSRDRMRQSRDRMRQSRDRMRQSPDRMTQSPDRLTQSPDRMTHIRGGKFPAPTLLRSPALILSAFPPCFPFAQNNAFFT